MTEVSSCTASELSWDDLREIDGFDSFAQARVAPKPFESTIRSLDGGPRLAPMRPKLAEPVEAEPKRHYALDLLDLQNDIEELVDQYVEQSHVQIKEDMKELEELEESKHAAMRKHAAEVAAQQTWSIWSTIAQYVASAGSIVLGISITAVAPVAGGLIIASGALGLSNRVLNDVGAWNRVAEWITSDTERQSAWAQRIDTIVFIASVGLGLVGGIMAISAGAFNMAANASADDVAKKVGMVMSVAGSAVSAGTRFGGALADRRALRLQANIRETEANLFDTRQEMNNKTKDVKETIELATSVTEEIHRVITESQVYFD